MKPSDKLTDKSKMVSRDSLDSCANYARLVGSKVEVETLYRYSKPVTRMMSIAEYNKMMTDID